MPLRLNTADRRLFKAAASRRGISVAEFIRESAREKATEPARRFASLEIDPDYRMPAEASENPRAFIRATIERRHAVHR